MSVYGILNEDLNIDLDDKSNGYLGFIKAEKVIATNIRKHYQSVLEIFKSDKDLKSMIYDKQYDYYEVYPMRTIQYRDNGSSGIRMYIDDDIFKYFYGSIYYMYFGNYLHFILKKNYSDDSNYNISNYNKFEQFCDSKINSLKSKIESAVPFIDVYLNKPSQKEIQRHIKDNEGNRIIITMEFKVKDDYTSKLLGLNSTKDDRFNKIINSIKDKDKESIIKIYDESIQWMLNPKPITRKMNISFGDITHICKLIKFDSLKLSSIVNQARNNFKSVPAKDFISDDMDEKYIISRLGNDIKMIEDMNSGSGDYIVLAKGKLHWINLEHNEIEDNILNLPFGGDLLIDYSNEILTAILKDFDAKKKYFLLSDGGKPVL